MSRSWDVFCKVVDNFGDAAVCWRLAQQLAGEHAGRVRLWIDDPAPLAALCPALVPAQALQVVNGVEVRHWRADTVFGGPADVAVVPRGFAAVPGEGRRSEFAATDALPAEPLIPGAHNRENAAAATAAARAAGIPDSAIAEALLTFPGVQHRLEPVRELAGVRYVNDSKATNTAAARRALAAFAAPLLVILGGSLKGESFDELAADTRGRARAIYLIGEATEELAAALDRAGATYERAGTLAVAVAHAAAAARPGDVVLLSPACASFDQFDNFEHRGEEYRRLVSNLDG